MRAADEIYQKVYSTPRVPRVVSKSNQQYDLRDSQHQDTMSSWGPSSTSKSNGKLVTTPWTTEKLEDLLTLVSRQTEKINKFGKEAQALISDMNYIENFELFENSSELCLDCNAHWQLGIILCSYGRNMKSTRSPTKFDLNNREVTSIAGHVIKKNRNLGATHGGSERRKMYHPAKQLLCKKARQARRPPYHTLKMIRRRRIQKVTVRHRMERTPPSEFAVRAQQFAT